MSKKESKCKKCRRLKTKLFLKGSKCLSYKCPLSRKPYPPGNKPKKVFLKVTEYSRLLAEKQKLKSFYNLRDYQLKRYIKEILEKSKKYKDLDQALVEKLELRLDNVIYRLGWADSRAQARQLISHKYFLVNKIPVNIPSYQLKVGEIIEIKPQKLKKKIFQNLKEKLKNVQLPSYLQLDLDKLQAKIISKPKVEDLTIPVDLHSIFEFYAK
jgi:small subunit ribosomal protein S4